MKPNNVTRLLDSRHISFEAFELPEEKLGAMEAAQFMGVAPDLVYKTIVVVREGKGKPILAVVPGTKEVDLKLVAKVVGEKKVILPTERQAESLTGLQVGGISPLALLNRGFQILLDSSSGSHSEIYISGGQRGLNIRLPVADLVSLTNAKVVDITH
jgi:Cys-tRNA(Pro)/Cys-tRNA(Cys) deacylase